MENSQTNFMEFIQFILSGVEKNLENFSIKIINSINWSTECEECLKDQKITSDIKCFRDHSQTIFQFKKGSFSFIISSLFLPNTKV